MFKIENFKSEKERAWDFEPVFGKIKIHEKNAGLFLWMSQEDER